MADRISEQLRKLEILVLRLKEKPNDYDVYVNIMEILTFLGDNNIYPGQIKYVNGVVGFEENLYDKKLIDYLYTLNKERFKEVAMGYANYDFYTTKKKDLSFKLKNNLDAKSSDDQIVAQLQILYDDNIQHFIHDPFKNLNILSFIIQTENFRIFEWFTSSKYYSSKNGKTRLFNLVDEVVQMQLKSKHDWVTPLFKKINQNELENELESYASAQQVRSLHPEFAIISSFINAQHENLINPNSFVFVMNWIKQLTLKLFLKLAIGFNSLYFYDFLYLQPINYKGEIQGILHDGITYTQINKILFTDTKFIKKFFTQKQCNNLLDEIVNKAKEISFEEDSFNGNKIRQLVEIYFSSSINETFDSHMKDLVDQGYIFYGYGNYEQFVNDLAIDHFDNVKRTRNFVFTNYIKKYYGNLETILEFSKNLPDEQLDVLKQYSSSSAVMNNPFKEQSFVKSQLGFSAKKRRPNETEHYYIKKFDDIFRKAPVTTTPFYCWRGVGFPEFDDQNLELDIFKSLSLSFVVSSSYLREHKCCLMRVLVPAGTPLISLDYVQRHKNGGLFEFVLPRWSRFSLVKQRSDSTPFYDVQVFTEEANLAPGRLRHVTSKKIKIGGKKRSRKSVVKRKSKRKSRFKK